mmetsp:Transcript_68016/g.142026  ORF Transcript_68016/g.142026 Transcript_68016/m.142026 type:complete len:789 (-) Transcript_68016:105-2471(-)
MTPAIELVARSIPEQKQLEDGSGVLPLTLGPSAGRSVTADELAKWTADNEARLRSLALQHGAVLIRGCGINTPEDFGAVSGALQCQPYDYVGGAAPRTELVKGLVFTSNESPPDQPIPFHHELAQSPTPPAYILFSCAVEAQEGGATPIIHSAEVATFFEKNFPDFARKVEALGVRYVRVMPEVTDPTSAQGRSWKETYNAGTREEAEAVMRKQGTSWEWLPNGDCKTTTAVLPALKTDPRTGKRVFFNSMIAAFTGWNDARNVGENAVVLGDGSPVDKEVLLAVAKFMEERRVVFRWKKGDILLVDNTLVMHARETFVPPRRVLASLRGTPLVVVEALEVGCSSPLSIATTTGLDPSTRAVPATKKPVRVGVIGTGAMGKEHIRNLALIGEGLATIAAIADPDPNARMEAVADMGAERSADCLVFEDYREMLWSNTVDAVIICTPNFQHIEVLRDAIPSGKHILCEKPLCSNVEDCLEVERLLEAQSSRKRADSSVKKGIFMTGMEYRWMPPISRLIQETDSGNLGQLHTLVIREHRFPFLTKVANWNRFNRYTGGTLVEKACHFFDLMRRIVHSEPVSVYATGGQAMNHKDEIYGDGEPDILDHAFVTVTFANGAKAMLDLCMFAEDEQTETVTAVCELGKVEAKAPESTVRVLRRRSISRLGRVPPPPDRRGVPEVVTLPVPEDLAKAGFHEGATFFELQSFFAAATGASLVPVSARDGRIAVMMGAAAQESILNKCVVHLDVPGMDRNNAARVWELEASATGLAAQAEEEAAAVLGGAKLRSKL